MGILVRDTKAGRSIAAYIVMRGGKCVATVQFHFGDSGMVRVNVWSEYGDPFEGSASGYGYDKRTAAASGAVIDGYKIENDGHEWDRQLKSNGYTVYQAI